jgi:putative DNA methylase
VQVITFRLADSLPTEILDAWKEELERLEPTRRQVERERRIAQALDSGYGACWLRRPEIAEIVETALLHFDGIRYHMLAWCIMPNHIHVLVSPLEGHRLDQIVHSWKSFTAQRCNQVLGRRGEFWMREYHDRFIRDETHLERAAAYIEANPVMARLVVEAELWRFSSAWHRARAENRG